MYNQNMQLFCEFQIFKYKQLSAKQIYGLKTGKIINRVNTSPPSPWSDLFIMEKTRVAR